MYIVLDTNVLRENFLLNSWKFVVLFDYLKKTNSKIVVPQIVYEEMAAVYERELTAGWKKFKDTKKALENLLIDSSAQNCNIEIGDEVKKYLTFLKKKLEISDGDIVPYKDNYLQETVYRAIRRVKPCSEKGEEFRDTLLWLTVLDIASKIDKKMLILISNNAKEFASDGGCLHPSLLKEAEDKGLTIKYYNSLERFVEDHATKIEYITSEWLLSTINLDTINEHVLNILEHEEYLLLRWVEHEGKEPTGYFNPISSFMNIDDFHVYEMMDGSYLVEALYNGEVEIEFELKEEVKENILNYGYSYYVPFRAITKCLYPQIQITVAITIKNKEVKNFEIVKWDFI